MKITLGKAEESLTVYVSKELCPKLSDWRKWVIPIMVGSYIPKLEKAFYDNKDILVSSGFVDQDNNIDLDLLYDKFHKVAEESGEITQEIPYMGTVRLSSRDIESFYRIARNEPSVSRPF